MSVRERGQDSNPHTIKGFYSTTFTIIHEVRVECGGVEGQK